jgi:murein L,D-transpeptidase YcbB/YkuD
MFPRTLYIALAVAAAALSAGCKGATKYSPQSVSRVFNVNAADLRAAIAARTGHEDRPAWVTEPRWQRVRMVYQRFGNSPLWLEQGGLEARAGAVLGAIREAPAHALDTSAYPIAEIERVVNAKRLTDTASAGTLADADVLLTSAYVAYAADMLTGQVDPKTVSQAWFIAADQRALDSAIVRGVESPDMKAALDSMAPQDSDYKALKNAYARYRRIAATGGWPTVASKGAASPELRARLTVEFSGDSGGAQVASAQTSTGQIASAQSARTQTASGEVDSAAMTAKSTSPRRADGAAAASPAAANVPALLRQFQHRYGLEPTGRLDQPTLAALNVSAADRAQQIGANMERHRWLPHYLGSRYIYVNVPAFELTAYDSGRKVLEMKVVVGEEYEGKVTPVFADSMETVVFRPYWLITPDIQRKEIEPKVEADPGYLARNNMEYYKDKSGTRIRQKPGEKNALGLVKFLFPNSFNIYLHDTPAKALFQKADRAASHGCIRVEKPAELAQWVLGWPPEKVHDAMYNGPDSHGVPLPQKIPVYIVYFTVYARDGQLVFSPDIYGRDEKLKEAVSTNAAT